LKEFKEWRTRITEEESKQPPKPKASRIIEDVFANAPRFLQQKFVILLLGSTGQGKTAFLDLLANLSQIYDGVRGIEECKDFHQESAENNKKSQTESQTSEAITYEFKIGHGTFRIIDTPGFGDTRGIEVDEENVEKIKKTILAEGGVNCICVIQSGRAARLEAQLKYSFTQLTNILPKAISK
jgi:predicted GTPase